MASSREQVVCRRTPSFASPATARAPVKVGDTYFRLVAERADRLDLSRLVLYWIEQNVWLAAEGRFICKLTDRHAGNKEIFTLAGLASWLYLAKP
jgi:hypothetical protein